MYNLPHFRNGLRMQIQLQNAHFFGGEGRSITTLHTCTLNAILLKNGVFILKLILSYLPVHMI